LKPRSVTPFYAFITNPEVKTGYIPLNKSIDGIYFGEASLTQAVKLTFQFLIQVSELTTWRYPP